MAVFARVLCMCAVVAPHRARPRACATVPRRCVANAVKSGDFVTIHYTGTLDNGEVFETTCQEGKTPLQFEVGSGKMIKGMDRLVTGMSVGDKKKERFEPDDAYGSPKEELVINFPAKAAPAGLEKGVVVRLSNGVQATVTDVTDESITVDANNVLAGKPVTFEVEVVSVTTAEQLEKITFGAGCFWGPELAFQRVPGVVSTAVGYSNGHVDQPTYEQVCSGQTGHAEVVQVTYSKDDVTPWQLCETMYDSLKDPTQVNGQGNDWGTQYRAGIYYHTEEQKEVAEKFIAQKQSEISSGKVAIEIVAVDNYSDAEDYHQQYLAKGGRNGMAQSPAKGCTDPIRCYG